MLSTQSISDFGMEFHSIIQHREIGFILPTVSPSWVKLKADRLGAKDPWCGEAIPLSSRL